MLENKQNSKKKYFIREIIGLKQQYSIVGSEYFDFKFENVKMPYETFKGKLFEIRYILVATLSKSFSEMKARQRIKVVSFSDTPNPLES